MREGDRMQPQQLKAALPVVLKVGEVRRENDEMITLFLDVPEAEIRP